MTKSKSVGGERNARFTPSQERVGGDNAPRHDFDLVKVTHAPRYVGLSAGTIRNIAKRDGLRLFSFGGNTFFSRAELAQLIMQQPEGGAR